MSIEQESMAVDELGTALKVHLTTDTSSSGWAATSEAKNTAPRDATSKETPGQTTPAESKQAEKKEGGGYERWTLKDESSLDYGYYGATRGKGIETVSDDSDKKDEETYYITTAINYTNGPAHMGHAYEATTTDVIARYHRLSGKHKAVYFLTGTDEHGQKIANTAQADNREPIDICNQYSTGFRVLNQRLLVSNDDYVRTTQARHKRTAQALWEKCQHDIYLDTYTGWYNVKEETFVTDSDAQLWEYKDPTTGQPLKKVDEQSYFFAMSKYKDALIQHITDNPEFIQPETHRNFTLQRLQSDDLRDLSISRTTFAWGVPVPAGFEKNHVMYVWVDALSNYLTGVNGLNVVDDAAADGLSRFWPADNHVIGKDILWFHTVIWPSLLMSAKLPLPKTVYAHGFVNDKDGKKMSKSLGNVVDPHDMLDQFHVDTFRWYLCKEAPYGGELSFSSESMIDMHNADLVGNIGNCVNRATSLCGRFCPNGTIPDVPPPERAPIDWPALCRDYQAKMEAHELQGAFQVAAKGFSDLNGWFQEEQPWAKKGDEFATFRQSIVRGALEAIYVLAHLLLPVMPITGKRTFEKLGTPPVTLRDLQDSTLRNLKVGTQIETKGEVLYAPILGSQEEKKAAAAKKKDDYAESKRKKEAAKAAAKAKAGAGGADPNQADFTKLDIRVGQIVKVWNHPDADKLYCEEIDVGEAEGPREIASGLRPFYTLEEMQNKKVLVICNLKPQKLVGFKSHGMVLAAKKDDKVELVSPPDTATIGERVTCQGVPPGEPISAAQVQKRKVFEAVAANLKTSEACVATWNDQAVETTTGPCKVPTLVGAPIS